MVNRNQNIRNDIQNGRKVFGSLPSIDYSSFADMYLVDKLKGYIAENVIGGMLNLLTYEHEDMFIAHRVTLHDEELDGETDHVIVYENTIVLLETKSSAVLKITSTSDHLNSVKINGREGRYSNTNHLASKVEKYGKRFPEHRIIGGIVFTDSRTRTANAPGNLVHVLTTKQLHSFLQQIFETSEPVPTKTNTDTVVYFAQNVM